MLGLKAEMTIIQLISDRYNRRHTREGGYPVFKTTFYDSLIIIQSIDRFPLMDTGQNFLILVLQLN